MPFRVRSVLVASDLSETASGVLRTAGALAGLTGAELHLVHAAGEEEPEYAPRRLEEQARGAIPSTVEVTSSRVAAGRAHEVILERAAEVDADLLVIGPHRNGPDGGQVLGTTADRLVRTSDIPCLIVYGGLSLPLRRVLVPSDLSEAARGALDMALIWASALRLPSASGGRTQLEVLHVLPRASSRTDRSDRDSVAEAKRSIQAEVAAAGERTGHSTLLEVETEVVEGEAAADEILRRAADKDVDLLVLGTHGESALSRALVGSVSSAVARRAERSVLLVPPALWRLRQAREAEVRPAG